MITQKLVPIESGGEISIKLFGDLNDPAIIFANGSNFNYKQFEHVYLPKLQNHLRDEYSYLLYDYIGYGYSSDLNGKFDFDEMADQQIELMDALNIEEAHLFGLSKGSAISHLVAVKYPDRVLSLGGYGTPNIANPDKKEQMNKYYNQRLEQLQTLRDKFNERISEENYDMVFDKIFIPSMFEKPKSELNIFQRLGSWYMRNKLKSMIMGPRIGYLNKLFRSYVHHTSNAQTNEFIEYIESIAVPTLLIHGSNDDYVPVSSSELLAQWNDHSTLRIIEGYRHNIPTLVPWQGKKIMHIYSNFIKEVENNGK